MSKLVGELTLSASLVGTSLKIGKEKREILLVGNPYFLGPLDFSWRESAEYSNANLSSYLRQITDCGPTSQVSGFESWREGLYLGLEGDVNFNETGNLECNRLYQLVSRRVDSGRVNLQLSEVLDEDLSKLATKINGTIKLMRDPWYFTTDSASFFLM